MGDSFGYHHQRKWCPFRHRHGSKMNKESYAKMSNMDRQHSVIAGKPALRTKEIDHEQRKDNTLFWKT
jgi:hypothetical protein